MGLRVIFAFMVILIKGGGGLVEIFKGIEFCFYNPFVFFWIVFPKILQLLIGYSA